MVESVGWNLCVFQIKFNGFTSSITVPRVYINIITSLCLWFPRLTGPDDTWFKLGIRKRSVYPGSAPSRSLAITTNPPPYR